VGKYNVNINMNNRNSSHTLILEQIKPNSFVLEMGCATGYMTKYMKEKLGCTVDVIEKDAEAIKQAAQYARGVYCGDIDTDGWFSHYKIDGSYDYILFADVLEHLMFPLEALTLANKLLKDDGKIIVSIPNICHNDIIIKLFYDRFTYTNLGLLDSTHIHFWGIPDFAELLNKAGLKSTNVEEVKMPTQGTEQRTDFKVNGQLMNLLMSRANGEVYQWVFTCERK